MKTLKIIGIIVVLGTVLALDLSKRAQIRELETQVQELGDRADNIRDDFMSHLRKLHGLKD